MRFPLHLTVKPPALWASRVLAEQKKAKGQTFSCHTCMRMPESWQKHAPPEHLKQDIMVKLPFVCRKRLPFLLFFGAKQLWHVCYHPLGWNPGRAIAPAGTWGGNQEIGFWFLAMAHPVGKYVAFLLDPRRPAPESRKKATQARA